MKIKNILTVSVVIACFFCFMFFSSESAQGAAAALSLCGKTVVPCLFPFMVLSGILLSCGGGELLGKMCGKAVGTLFSVSDSGVFPILLGLISGCPSGAVAVADTVTEGKLSRSEGERLLGLCSNPAPGFVLAAAKITGCRAWILLTVQFLTVLTLGAVSGKLENKGKRQREQVKITEEKNYGFGFVKSVKKSCCSIIYVCGFTVMFGSIIAVLSGTGAVGAFSEAVGISGGVTDAVIKGFLEMTSGIGAVGMISASERLKTAVTCAVLGWSGLSVHLQVSACTSGSGLKMTKYYLYKLIQTPVSFTLAWLIFGTVYGG